MKLSIAHLRAAGLTDSQIIKALEEADAERRERWRIKARKQRARTQSLGDGGDNRDVTYKEPSSLTKKERKGRKIKMPADWKPSEADRAYARSKGWSDDRIDREAERFRNYYRANGKTMEDWSPKWENWVTSAYQNGGGQPHGRRRGSVLDASDRLGEKLRALGASDDYVPGTSGPRPLQLDQEVRQPSLRLIPKG